MSNIPSVTLRKMPLIFQTQYDTESCTLTSFFAHIALRLAVLLSMTLAATYTWAGDPSPRSVLLIDQENQSRVWNFDLSNALRSVLIADPGAPITVYADNLDLARVAGPDYEKALRAFLIEKYRNLPIGVIVVNGARALDLVLSLRLELWPNVPVVFAAVDDEAAAHMKSVPNVTGHIIRLTLRDMVSTARLVVPNLKQIVLVGDPLERNTFFRGFFAEIPELKNDNLELIDLTGLPMTELKQRTATLSPDSAIAYTTLTVDGAGIDYLPREAVAAIATVANRPIVTGTVNFIGYGAVGGLVVSAPPIGEQAGRLALRILKGESASNIPVTVGDFKKPVFDWREIKRWNVSEDRLPTGSEFLFREPTAWERYRSQIVVIVLALLLQAALIVGLLFEYLRRRRAEAAARESLSELARVNRIATASELSASIVHEIAQPLGAMVTNANAALRWIGHTTPDLGEVRAALYRIVSTGQRGAEVVQSIRAMFGKEGPRQIPVDINQLIREVVVLMQGDLQKHQALVEFDLDANLPSVLGDRIQLQQVMLNLIMNAAEAMDGVTDRARVLRVQSAIREPNGVLVAVEDTGTGIEPDAFDRIFETRFTTKSSGMGIGLAICRSIIQSHNGKLWAAKGIQYGSVFQFLLPVGAADGQS
jgi:signal transduction histidine kinase